jgi:hypothetical protein
MARPPNSRLTHDFTSWPRVVAGAAIGLLTLSPGLHAQDQPTPARPFIELEKTRFASVEQVFFWIGVNAPNDHRIPRNLRDTCRLTITGPDGTKRVDVVSWPVDGMLDRGWRGGHGLGAEPPQPGQYSLVFEFAEHKTSPAFFTVEELPILRQINGEFVFPEPLVLASADVAVTLVVRNGSSETIRFPHRGEALAGVWGHLEKATGERWSASFSVSQAVLFQTAGIAGSGLGEDRFTWELARRVPTVVLGPREIHRLNLPLRDSLDRPAPARPIPDGAYDIEFSTTVQMLVGEPNGPWAEFWPIRLNIASSAHGVR